MNRKLLIVAGLTKGDRVGEVNKQIVGTITKAEIMNIGDELKNHLIKLGNVLIMIFFCGRQDRMVIQYLY